MKKTLLLGAVALLGASLAGCGSQKSTADSTVKTSTTKSASSHSSHRRATKQSSSSSTSESSASSTDSSTADSATESSSSSQERVIKSSNDAMRLVAHMMATVSDQGIFQTTEVDGGYKVTRPDTNQEWFVHYNGDVEGDDGTVVPYAQASATENNELPNNVYTPSDN